MGVGAPETSEIRVTKNCLKCNDFFYHQKVNLMLL